MSSFKFFGSTLAIIVLLKFSIVNVDAQNVKDSVTVLNEAVVTMYPDNRPLFQSPSAISILDLRQLKLQHGYSLVPALNSLPGVRMEERSPGSYRVSIRGSLLRSPFGIRNVKIYLDEFPLTDAGGNTYLNLLDPGNINSIEVHKGPDGSLFGANTGGVILIHPLKEKLDTSKYGQTNFHLSGGSFGLFQERLSWQKRWNKYQVSISQNFQRSDGYRENSHMQRHYVHLIQKLDYHKKASLKLLTFYSDLNYRTPGGLTFEQFQRNPKAARYPTTKLPGANSQKAGILNKTFYGGLSHEINFSERLRHVTALFGSITDYKNPFITHYEIRKENTLGVRSFLEIKINENNPIKINWNIGVEGQNTNSSITNFGNRQGIRDTIQISDDLSAKQYFYFTKFTASLTEKLLVEAAMSLNNYTVKYKKVFPIADKNFTKKLFDPLLLPRLSASYKFSHNFVIRATASKGFSAPTISEIRPSDNLFYTRLQPEFGWNYETGLRIRSNREIFYFDAAIFYYKLQNAIVSRKNEKGQEFFANAGGTKQPGLETQLTIQLIPTRTYGFIRGCILQNSFTHNAFTFTNYLSDTINYSGNKLTGVPSNILVSSVAVNLPFNTYVFLQYNYTDEMPLNDANTFHAQGYNLLQIKGGWNFKIDKINMELFAGVDNLLNKKYSLGNDINAAANRFYNAAPARNAYGGMNITF